MQRDKPSCVLERTTRKELGHMMLADDAKTQIGHIIEEQQNANILRNNGIEPRNRILIVGSLGNGKTSLSESVALYLDLPFYVVRYNDIVGSDYQKTRRNFKSVFEYVLHRPSVLLFDNFKLTSNRAVMHSLNEI